MAPASTPEGLRRGAGQARPADPRVSVIPAKNEASTGSRSMTRLTRRVGSPRRSKWFSRLRRGNGNALACGFAAATCDIIVMFDADCSADPDEIPRFVAACGPAPITPNGAASSTVAAAPISPGSGQLATGGQYPRQPVIKAEAAYTDLCYGYNALGRHPADATLTSPSTGTIPKSATVWGDGFEIETVINCRIAAPA